MTESKTNEEQSRDRNLEEVARLLGRPVTPNPRESGR